jgi:hypothetical protein
VIADPQVRFAVRDSVEMAEFTSSAAFSPDRRYFVIVTERGVLPEGIQEATIWLFNSAEVSESLNGRLSSPAAPIALTRL